MLKRQSGNRGAHSAVQRLKGIGVNGLEEFKGRGDLPNVGAGASPSASGGGNLTGSNGSNSIADVTLFPFYLTLR
jgi:hypothetical protein